MKDQKLEPLKRTLYQTTSNAKVEAYNAKLENKRKLIRITDYSPIEYEELVFLPGRDFEKIFGYKDGSPEVKHLIPVVKVTNPSAKKSVHLLYRTSWELREDMNDKDYAAITYSAIKKISTNKDELDNLNEVEISKGSVWRFFGYHPILTVRCSIYLGILGIMIGLMPNICDIIKFIRKLILSFINLFQ